MDELQFMCLSLSNCINSDTVSGHLIVKGLENKSHFLRSIFLAVPDERSVLVAICLYSKVEYNIHADSTGSSLCHRQCTTYCRLIQEGRKKKSTLGVKKKNQCLLYKTNKKI